MSRTFFILLFVLSCSMSMAQQVSMSLGVFTGITGAHTDDKGINVDPRYTSRYEVRLAPIGINVGIDYEGIGLMVSPGLVNLGQNFYVLNTLGGQVGIRKVELQYINLPVSFKVHLVKTSFLKVSVIASFGPAFLLGAKEEVSHSYSKIAFPAETYPILPPDYIVEYDGVLAPEINQYSISKKEDFKSIQLFAGAGFRTDWDVSNNWRVSLDLRANYGLSEPRSDTYVQHLKSSVSLYEIPGNRRDMFVQLTLGISRYIEFEKSDRDRQKKLKGTTKQYKPMKYPGQKTRQSRPKD